MLWRNYYCHGDCPLSNDPVYWHDEWSCCCNDRCPKCDTEVEPFRSVELDDEPPPRSVKMEPAKQQHKKQRAFSGDLKIKYLHLRDVEFFTTKSGEKKEGFVTKGGTTIAYAVYDHPEAPGPVVRYGYASCHPLDTFDRKQGNIKAAGRLRSLRLGKEFVVDEPEITDEKILAFVIGAVNRDLQQRQQDGVFGGAQSLNTSH